MNFNSNYSLSCRHFLRTEELPEFNGSRQSLGLSIFSLIQEIPWAAIIIADILAQTLITEVNKVTNERAKGNNSACSHMDLLQCLFVSEHRGL